MRFEPFCIEHKERFDKVFSGYCPVSADALFTNLALWQFGREIEVAFVDDMLVVKQQYKGIDHPHFLYPVGSGDKTKVVSDLKKSFGTVVMRAVNETQKEELRSIVNFDEIYTPSYSDYLYSIKDLIDLKGRSYHAKKNFVNRFLSTYNSSYERLNSDNQEELLHFINHWFINAPYSNNAEELGLIDLVKHFEVFNVRVGILRVDERIIAFTISEELSNDMVVVHVEKADPSFMGSYQAINKIHLEKEWSDKKIVNREEDLGLEGLRKAKLSYHPVGYVQKYQITL